MTHKIPKQSNRFRTVIGFLLTFMMVFAMTLTSFADESPEEGNVKTESTEYNDKNSQMRYLHTMTSGNPGYSGYSATHYLYVGGTIYGRLIATYTGSGTAPDFSARLWGKAHTILGTVCGSYDDSTENYQNGSIDFTASGGVVTGNAISAYGNLQAWINGTDQGVTCIYLP